MDPELGRERKQRRVGRRRKRRRRRRRRRQRARRRSETFPQAPRGLLHLRRGLRLGPLARSPRGGAGREAPDRYPGEGEVPLDQEAEAAFAVSVFVVAVVFFFFFLLVVLFFLLQQQQPPLRLLREPQRPHRGLCSQREVPPGLEGGPRDGAVHGDEVGAWPQRPRQPQRGARRVRRERERGGEGRGGRRAVEAAVPVEEAAEDEKREMKS